MAQYNEEQVVMELRKKKDLQIIGKQIQQITGQKAVDDVGKNSRGKIDFLVNHCGYVHFNVSEFKI